MTAPNLNDAERSEIEALLPWYAAGTLSREEAQRVDAVLASDAELAHRYALAREEMAETVTVNESLGAPSARMMEKIFLALDAERAPTRSSVSSRVSNGIGAGWKSFIASLTPRTLAWSAMAAALLIVAQAAIITGVLIDHRTAPGYQTASTADNGATDRGQALVRFAPSATAAEITAFLDRYKVSVAAGPMAGGLYRLRLPVAATDTAAAAQLLQTMRQGGPLTFAAPATATP